MKRLSSSPRPLALSMAIGALPGLALAQAPTTAPSAREQSLEARVAELEKLVQQLIVQQQAAQPQISQSPAQAAAAPAGNKPKIQTAPIMPSANPGTRFSYGGFVKLDAMVTDTGDGEIPDGSVGRLFYLPSAIPVGGANENSDTDMGVQFSRFWFAADTDLDSGHKLT
jgi:hypothetical protein